MSKQFIFLYFIYNIKLIEKISILIFKILLNIYDIVISKPLPIPKNDKSEYPNKPQRIAITFQQTCIIVPEITLNLSLNTVVG